MARQVTQFKCLIISPSDVDDARAAIGEALLDFNAHVGEGLGVKVEGVRWESHTHPAMGESPQDIINKQIVDSCDFGIAIFWSRLGSPTPRHVSGSVEEIERLLAKGANVMVYFCNAPVPQEALRDEQYGKLQEIKRSFRERGLFASYSNIDELRRILPLHVNGVVNGMLIQQRAAGQPIPSQGTVTAPMPDVRVTVAAAFFGRGGPTSAGVVVEVQNHSPADFFFSSLMVHRSDGRQAFFQRNFITGEYQTPRKVEPGNSFSFTIDPQELERAMEGQEPTVVVAKDKIDRRFQSRPGDLATALANALDLAKISKS